MAASGSPAACAQLLAQADEPALIALTAHVDRLVALGALRAAALRAPGAALLTALLNVARQGNQTMRRAALEALKRLGGGDTRALEALVVALEDADAELRRDASHVLRSAPALPATLLRPLCDHPELADAARRAICGLEPSLLLPDDAVWTPKLREALDRAPRSNAAPCPLALAYGGSLPMEWIALWSAGLALPAGLEFAAQPLVHPPLAGAAVFAQDMSGDYALWSSASDLEPGVWWFGGAGEVEQIADDMLGFLEVLSAGVGCASEAARDVRAYRASGGQPTQASFEAWLKANKRAYKPDKAATRALAKWVSKRIKPAELAALIAAVST
jgi:hypothetical protein